MTSRARPRVILDCDPGHDDAIAILLAAKHLDVLGITTVAGNQTIEKVTANALKVVELGSLSIPVCRGSTRPLLSEPRPAGSIHGETGLDGYDLPLPVRALDPRHGVEFIIDTVMAVDGVTLIPTGPLTNIATALRLEPRIAERLEAISLMGGSATHGNVTATAEFNIWADAEAADIVFRSGVPLTMCGLNLTHQAGVTPDDIDRIRAIGNEAAKAVAGLLTFYLYRVRAARGATSAPLHDPCAVAALLAPELFTFLDMHVAVELQGRHTYGMTVCDARLAHFGAGAKAAAANFGLPAPNTRVAMTIDRAAFFDLVINTLALY